MGHRAVVALVGACGLSAGLLQLPPARLAAPAARTRGVGGGSMLLDEADEAVDFETMGSLVADDYSPVGILLLSVGAPETPEDVEEYLYNVFCDPEILTLPPILSWAFKRPLAWAIAKMRAKQAKASMRDAGGRSPQLSTIQAQADALRDELVERGVDARPYLAMRYWHPFANEAVEAMKADGVEKLVIVPLYPQFSISTSGSALKILESMLYNDPGFPMKSSVVPAWYNRRGFLEATARAIQKSVASLPGGGEAAHILYTAQGLPLKYVTDLGDPYEEQVERCIELVTAELSALGTDNAHSLGYQGAFGPSQLRWLQPSTADEIEGLAAAGVTDLVLVPISFVFEHMGTLNEMDREYKNLAASVGIANFVRVPTLGTDPGFVDALATVVMEALPDLSRASMQQINDGEPVALNMVNEYTRLYTKDQLKIVPQEQPWGFTEEAELANGRLAMGAITLGIAFAVDPTLKLLAATYRVAKQVAPPAVSDVLPELPEL